MESEGIKRDLSRLALKDSRFTLIHTLLAGNGSVSDTGGRVRDRGMEEATCPWSRCERLEMALCLDSLRNTKENLWESNKQSQSETSPSLPVSLSPSLPLALALSSPPSPIEQNLIRAWRLELHRCVCAPHYAVRSRGLPGAQERALGTFLILISHSATIVMILGSWRNSPPSWTC